MSGECEGGMTDKQFCAYVRMLKLQISDVLDEMPDGEAKEKLQKLADNLQKTLED